MFARQSTSTTENNEDESVELYSRPSDDSLRQQRVLGHLTSREDEKFQEVEVDVDHSVEPKLSKDCRRMFEVVERGDFQTLSSLLTNYTTQFDAVDSKGNTALHCAVMKACHKRDTHEKYYSCINVLMKCQMMKINMPNKHGYTALGYALNELDVKCVKHMLNHPSSNRLYLDYYPGDRESTVREIIKEKFPELKELLPVPLMESQVSPDSDKKLLAALQHDNYGNFRKNLKSNYPNPWYDEPYHSSLLEIACQIKNRKQFVELLLENGAHPNIKNRVTGMPLLHATARSGNFELLEMFLEVNVTDTSVKDNEDRTILHWLAGLNERERGDKYKIQNYLELLLTSKYFQDKGVDDRDSSWNTALSIAVERGFKNRAKVLIMNGANVTVFGEGSIVLLSSMSSVLEEILDDCLRSNSKPVTSKDYSLEFEHRELLWNLSLRMVESQHLSDLLRHPVISTFLSLKWQKIKWFFNVDLVFYVTFVLFLTAYILYADSHNTPKDGGVANNTTGPFSFNDSYITSGMNDTNFSSKPNESSLHFLWLSLMALLSLLTLREIIQLFIHQMVYIVSPENWLEILLIVVTFVSCSGVVSSMVMKLHFSAVALLLGWLELLLMLGRLPQLSVQQEMLKTVTLTFLRFMAGYAIILIAFAFSFYILFKGSLELDGTKMFANPLLSVLKTIVMFTGEFDASSLTFDILPGTSHVIFLLFVFLVTIILLNLLNGLAVNDTGAIWKKAETLSLVARVKLIHNTEAMPNILWRCMKSFMAAPEVPFVLYPNMRNSIGYAASQSILRIITTKKQPHKKRKSIGNPDRLSSFTENFSELQLRQKELEKKLDINFQKTKDILDRNKELEEKFDSRLEEMKSIVLRHEVLQKRLHLIFAERSYFRLPQKKLEKKFDLKFEETKHFFLQILICLDIRKSERSLDES